MRKKLWQKKRKAKNDSVSISDNKSTHIYYMPELASCMTFKATIDKAMFVEEEKNRSDD